MRDMKRPMRMTGMKRLTMYGKQELTIRRAANHNVHVITRHGNVQAGRKGRKG
jgi:putative NIF3 family GTP cyclohydrolase 1 type 2